MALWRLRATVVDRPGFLAVLAASLALRSVNILSVGVHITEQGAVDDFLVDAPEELTAEQLLAAVERGRGRDAWVVRAEAHSLVDAPTRALDLATYLVREPAAVGTALAELLDAEASWQAEADDHDVGVTGSRMRVPAPGGGTWRVERPAPGFTPAEYARAQALLAVAAAVAPRAARTQVPHDSGPATAGAAPLRPRAADPPAPPPAGGVADTVAAATAGPAALLLADGRELTLRPGGPADLAAVRAMHGRCSPASLHQRYLGGGGGTGGPPDAQLARLLEPARGCALLLRSPGAFTDRVVAMATLVGEGVQAEVALLVEDAWQRRGIGTALLRRAVTVATAAGFDAVVAYTQAQNTAMHRTLRRLGVTFRTEHDGDLMTVTLPLGHTVEPCATGPVG